MSSNFRTLSSASINGDLAVLDTVYAASGNSNEWASTHTTVQTESANWIGGGYDDSALQAASGDWESTFTTVQDNSAAWDDQADLTDIIAASGDWNSTYTTVQDNSATWDNSSAIAFEDGNNGSIEIGELDTSTQTGQYAITITGRKNFAQNVASGAQAIAIGYDTRASQSRAIAIGGSAQATGAESIAIGGGGSSTIAQLTNSIAIGPNCQAQTNFNAQAIGIQCASDGRSALSYGYYAKAGTAADMSAAIGHLVYVNAADVSEFGRWVSYTPGSEERKGVVRCSGDVTGSLGPDVDAMVCVTTLSSETAKADGGSSTGSEAANTIPRGLHTIRRWVNDFYLDANDGNGNITTIPLDSTLGDNVHSHVQATSGDWNSTYTTVQAESAGWADHFDATEVQAASGDWNSTYTTVSAQSASWQEGASTGVVFDTSQGSVLDHASLKVKDTNTGYSATDTFPIGDTRGAHAVDLQLYRDNSDQVAGGVSSTIVGGQFNKIYANNFSGGGKYSAILGGVSNQIYGQYNTVIGGLANKIGDGITFFPVHGTTIGQSNFIKHANCFSYNDQAGSQFETKQVSTFNIHATNGFRLVTGSLNTPDPINIGDVLTCYDTDGHSKWASLSADEWNSTYTTVQTESAGWDSHADLTDVIATSGNWNSTYTTVQTESAGWDSHADLTDVIAASGDWNSTYTTVQTESADWESTYTTVQTESAGWDSHADLTDVIAVSGDWNSTYTTVQTESGSWGNANSVTTVTSTTYNQAVGNTHTIYNDDDPGVTGDITANLMAAADHTGTTVHKKIGSSHDVIITPPGGATIDGQSTFTLQFENESISIFSDGTNFYIT